MQCLVVATVVTLILSSMALITFFVLQEEQSNQGSFPVEYSITFDDPEEIPKAGRNYSYGFKQTGEVLVGFGSNSYEFRNYTNVQVTIQWPSANPRAGCTFTWCAVYTNQSSTFGAGLVVLDGEFGDTSLKLAVQANSTLLFEYKYEIYALNRITGACT